MNHDEIRTKLANLEPLLRAEVWSYIDAAKQAEADRDEARSGYHKLDKNWERHHEACMQPIREAVGSTDASIREIVIAIEANARIAKLLREHGKIVLNALRLVQDGYRAQDFKARCEAAFQAIDTALKGLA